MGLMVISFTSGCNKTDDNTSMTASTNSMATNSTPAKSP
jgi:hypothetical protein